MVGITSVNIRLFEVKSLKEKRSILKPAIERIRSRHHLSIAETDKQDCYSEAVIEFAVVGNKKSFIETIMQKILLELGNTGYFDIVSVDHEVISIWQDD